MILRSVVGNKSMDEVFSTVTLFEQASGARISLQKCEGLWLGSNRGWPGQPHNIRWTSRKIKIIGYHFGNVDTTQDNWDEKIFKFKKTLHPWKTRDLSLRGRSLVLNQLYLSYGIPLPLTHSPPWAQKQLTDTIWDFFNNGHPQQIKRSVCKLPRDCGGLPIPNLPRKIQAPQFMWIPKLLHLPDAKWKACILDKSQNYANRKCINF